MSDEPYFDDAVNEAEKRRKEPWEMTREEFSSANPVQHARSNTAFPIIGQREPGWKPGRDYKDYKEVHAIGAYLDTDEETAKNRKHQWEVLGSKVNEERFSVTPGKTLDVTTDLGREELAEIQDHAFRSGNDYQQELTNELKRRDYRYVSGGGYMGEKGELISLYPQDDLKTHGQHIESALAAGKPVPSHVLDAYPDLKAKHEERLQQAQQEIPDLFPQLQGLFEDTNPSQIDAPGSPGMPEATDPLSGLDGMQDALNDALSEMRGLLTGQIQKGQTQSEATVALPPSPPLPETQTHGPQTTPQAESRSQTAESRAAPLPSEPEFPAVATPAPADPALPDAVVPEVGEGDALPAMETADAVTPQMPDPAEMVEDALREPWQMTRAEFAKRPGAMFHGTDQPIESFEDKAGRGISFSSNEYHASNFGEHVYAAELGVTNSIDLEHLGSGSDEGDDRVSTRQIQDALKDHDINIDFGKERSGFTTDLLRHHMPEIIRQGKEHGFDSLKVMDYKDFESPETVVFSPNSIRSHYHSVRSAAEQGKPVPPHVLADYPDLPLPGPVSTPDTGPQTEPSPELPGLPSIEAADTPVLPQPLPPGAGKSEPPENRSTSSETTTLPEWQPPEMPSIEAADTPVLPQPLPKNAGGSESPESRSVSVETASLPEWEPPELPSPAQQNVLALDAADTPVLPQPLPPNAGESEPPESISVPGETAALPEWEPPELPNLAQQGRALAGVDTDPLLPGWQGPTGRDWSDLANAGLPGGVETGGTTGANWNLASGQQGEELGETLRELIGEITKLTEAVKDGQKKTAGPYDGVIRKQGLRGTDGV